MDIEVTAYSGHQQKNTGTLFALVIRTLVKGEDSYPHSSKAFLGILAYAQGGRVGDGGQANLRGSALCA